MTSVLSRTSNSTDHCHILNLFCWKILASINIILIKEFGRQINCRYVLGFTTECSTEKQHADIAIVIWVVLRKSCFVTEGVHRPFRLYQHRHVYARHQVSSQFRRSYLRVEFSGVGIWAFHSTHCRVSPNFVYWVLTLSTSFRNVKLQLFCRLWKTCALYYIVLWVVSFFHILLFIVVTPISMQTFSLSKCFTEQRDEIVAGVITFSHYFLFFKGVQLIVGWCYILVNAVLSLCLFIKCTPCPGKDGPLNKML